MNPLSRQRPGADFPDFEPSGAEATNKPVSHWRRRVFKNAHARGGRNGRLQGWSVKIQHQGRRHTFPLAAKTKTAAATEAKAIHDTLVAEGWEAAMWGYSAWARARAGFPKTDLRYWQDRLLRRHHRFPAAGRSSDHYLAAQIEHAGAGWFFPLGSGDPDVAATKAHRIYLKAVHQGWNSVYQACSRELVIGFEWCAHPLMWTYTTVHTLIKNGRNTPPEISPARPGLRRVLVLEPDAGVREALSWCIDQHVGFHAVPCDRMESLPSAVDLHKPCIILLNRNLAGQFGLPSPGRIAPLNQGVPALTYSVSATSDELFVSVSGGSQGCFLKRVQPDRLLEPITDVAARPVLSTESLLARVKSYFKELLRSRTDGEASGLNRLSRREREVLFLLSKGHMDKEIAQSLGISTWTVHGHIKSIFERLHVRTRTEAASFIWKSRPSTRSKSVIARNHRGSAERTNVIHSTGDADTDAIETGTNP
jgi:DNA-binding NarL/FixJ family response regulator